MLNKLYMIGERSRNNDAYMEGNIDFDQKVVYKNFSPPMDEFCDYCAKQLSVRRYVPISYLIASKINLMPGFRLSWWYTGDDITPEPLAPYLKRNTKSYLKNIFVR